MTTWGRALRLLPIITDALRCICLKSCNPRSCTRPAGLCGLQQKPGMAMVHATLKLLGGRVRGILPSVVIVFRNARRLSQTNNCHRTRVPACFCGRHLIDAHLLSVALLASVARTFCQSSLQDRWTGSRMPLNTVIAVSLGREAIHSPACLANAIAPFRSSLTNAHLRNCLISHAIHALLHQLH